MRSAPWFGSGLAKKVMVQQVSPAGGYLSQSSRVVHFGLGDRSKVDRIEIRWPRGLVQTVLNPGDQHATSDSRAGTVKHPSVGSLPRRLIAGLAERGN